MLQKMTNKKVKIKLKVSNEDLLSACNKRKYRLEQFNSLFPKEIQYAPTINKFLTQKSMSKSKESSTTLSRFKMSNPIMSLKEKRRYYLSQIYNNNKKTSNIDPPEFSLKPKNKSSTNQLRKKGFNNIKLEDKVVNVEYFSDNDNTEEKKKFYKIFTQ